MSPHEVSAVLRLLFWTSVVMIVVPQQAVVDANPSESDSTRDNLGTQKYFQDPPQVWSESTDSDQESERDDNLRAVDEAAPAWPVVSTGRVAIGEPCSFSHGDEVTAEQGPRNTCRVGLCVDGTCQSCPGDTCRQASDCSYQGEYTLCHRDDNDSTETNVKRPASWTVGSETEKFMDCPGTCQCSPGSCDTDLDCDTLTELCHGGSGRSHSSVAGYRQKEQQQQPSFHYASFDACNGVCRSPYHSLDPNDSAPRIEGVDYSVVGARESGGTTITRIR